MSFDQLLAALDLDVFGCESDCSASDFIQAAIKTGFYVDAKLRQSILRDVSDIIQCDLEDLNFLFETDSDGADAALLKVPTRRALLEMAVNDVASYKDVYPSNDLPAFSEAAE